MGKLEGKIAVITGGNSGIGLATVKQFVDEDEIRIRTRVWGRKKVTDMSPELT